MERNIKQNEEVFKVRNSREALGIILKHKKTFERGIRRTLFTTCALIISETTHVYKCVMIIYIPVELIKRTISRLSKRMISVARVTCVR